MLKNHTIKNLLKERLQQYTEIVDRLALDISKKKQIHTDFFNYIQLLERLSTKHLFLNDFTNIAVIILSAIVPILIQITGEANKDNSVSNYLNIATLLSVLLAIINGFRQSYKFREHWLNYRETVEKLILEGQSYFALSGKYSEFSDHEQAFKKFIESINLIRSKQVNNYISQLLSINDKEIEQSVSAEINARWAELVATKEKTNQRIQINEEINAFVKNNPDVSYYEIDHERKLINLFVNNNSFKGPEKFNFKNKSLSRLVYKVNTSFGDVEIHGLLSASTGVKNRDMVNKDFGSAGCICRRSDDTIVFVTCYHVVKHNSQDWDLFIPGNHDSVVDTESEIIGNIIDGEKSEELDTALVAVDKDIAFDELLPGQLALKEPVYLDEDNFSDYSEVYLISRTRNYKQIQGLIAAVNKPVTINYGTKFHRDNKNLDNLMIIHFVSTEPFSLTGDSGSLVFTKDGTAIGIVVGGDNVRASFVIPFSTINDRYNFKFE